MASSGIERMYTVQEVAKLTGQCKSAIYGLMATGILPYTRNLDRNGKPRSKRLVFESDFKNYQERLRLQRIARTEKGR